MRTLDSIVADIIKALEQQSNITIDEEHDIYKAFVVLLTHQNDLTNAMITSPGDYIYQNWVRYIAGKYVASFLRPNEGNISPGVQELKNRMRDYIIMNQLQRLGGITVYNDHIIDVCITFQLYSMKDAMSGFILRVERDDRNYIYEICRSAIKNYEAFVENITTHTTRKMGKIIT